MPLILALAIAAHLGPTQHALDALAHPRGRLWLFSPDWLEHLQHQGGIDDLHGQRAYDRIDMIGEPVAPLPSVDVAAPAHFVARHEGFGALLEGHRFVCCDASGFAIVLSGFNRIGAGRDQSPALRGLLTRPDEAHGGKRP